MSAVSPGPEKACPGSVRPPLLCTLLQAAHQVDWRSSDHLQPCETQNPSPPNAYPSYRTCFSPSCLLISARLWGFFAPEINYFIQTHPSHDWIQILKSVNHKDLTMLTHSKGVHCFPLAFPLTDSLVVHSFTNALGMHYECIGNALQIHWECITNALALSPVSLNIRQYRALNHFNSYIHKTKCNNIY